MGTYKQTVAPTLWPITLDEAKTQCFVTGTTDHDADLANLIQVATLAVEQRLNRQIMPATWTLTLDEFPDEILIDKPPVTTPISISYKNTAGTLTTLATAYYQVDLSTRDGPARIRLAYGYSWPETQVGAYGTVVVTFTAGYASAALVPLTIKHAIAFLVAHWFRNREPVVIGTITADLPSGLEMLLSLDDWGAYA